MRPMKVPPGSSQATIHIEIHHTRGTVVVNRPADNATACGTRLKQ